jgi:KipI family sensor histidine kinase inhibitor
VSGITLRPAGDRGILLEVPDGTAAGVARAISESVPGLVDVVPGHRTVLVTWVVEPSRDGLTEIAARAVRGQEPTEPGRVVEIPVTYDGIDLDEVSELVGLPVEEVVRAHCGTTYVVAFLGFAPGYGYLTGGDPRLVVPRRNEPRVRVPAGSVAIAGPYSGIYPREGPGGWRLIGTTPAVLFDPARDPPSLFSAGDRVRFVAT